MKTYRGSRDAEGRSFSVGVHEDIAGTGGVGSGFRKYPLPLRLDLKNHSPLGFWWGRTGSGAAQLSLALLADHLGNDVQALRHYIPFMGFLFRLQDGEGNPVASWEFTSSDIDAALDELLRASSPTWPFVGAFAVEMERQLRGTSARSEWRAISPDKLGAEAMEALGAFLTACGVQMEDPSEARAKEVLGLGAHAAVIVMALADRLGALPEPKKGMALVSELKAAQRQSHLLGEVERIRVLLGANHGESLEDALYRYTAAVQLGCAKKLEQRAAGVIGRKAEGIEEAADLLRDEVAAKLDTAAVQQPDVFRRWLEDRWQEFQQGVVDGILPRFWKEALGDLPDDKARATLREMLESYEPLGGLTLNTVPEYASDRPNEDDFAGEAKDITGCDV